MIFDATLNNKSHQVKVVEELGKFLISIDGRKPIQIDVVDKLVGGYTLLAKGKAYEFGVESKEDEFTILHRGNLYLVDMVNQKAALSRHKESSDKKIVAKMPGKIIKILAKIGDEVKKGQGLIIMEAMKMENELKAPSAGIVESIKVKEAATVDSGAELLIIK